MAQMSRIIADHRNHYAGLACLVLDILHVVFVRKQHRDPDRVLVLGLVENDRAAICDLCIGNDAGNICNITMSSQLSPTQSRPAPATSGMITNMSDAARKSGFV